MSDPRREAVTCGDVDDALADLLVHAVPEPDRAGLLAHVHSCSRCAAALADAVAVSEAMLEVAPAVESPDGFELRAVARMTSAAVSRPAAPSLTRALLPAAAVFLVLLGGFLGGGLTRSRSEGKPNDVGSAPILATSGDRLGVADVHWDAHAPRIVITMSEDVDWEGTWTCQLRGDGGAWVDVGTWTADDVNHGVWATGLPVELAGSPEMRILGSSGRVIASAALPG